MGYFLLMGTMTSRSSSRTACRLIARLEPISLPARPIIGTTPAVESVTRRLLSAMASPSMAMASAAFTLSKL